MNTITQITELEYLTIGNIIGADNLMIGNYNVVATPRGGGIEEGLVFASCEFLEVKFDNFSIDIDTRGNNKEVDFRIKEVLGKFL